MIYAFVLLALVAVLTWSAWSGIEAPNIDTPGIRASIIQVLEDTENRLTGAVKEKVREELHQVIDERLE